MPGLQSVQLLAVCSHPSLGNAARMLAGLQWQQRCSWGQLQAENPRAARLHVGASSALIRSWSTARRWEGNGIKAGGREAGEAGKNQCARRAARVRRAGGSCHRKWHQQGEENRKQNENGSAGIRTRGQEIIKTWRNRSKAEVREKWDSRSMDKDELKWM